MPPISTSSICSPAPDEAQSDGAKPLGATEYFNRLGAAGMRRAQRRDGGRPALRSGYAPSPFGKGRPARGLLRKLQAISAGTGLDLGAYGADPRRPVFGSEVRQGRPSRGSSMPRSCMERDLAKLHLPTPWRCAPTWRAHKPPNGPFDIKLGEGGLVDLEFAVQILQLRHRKSFRPQLGSAIDGLIREALLPAEIEEAHGLLPGCSLPFASSPQRPRNRPRARAPWSRRRAVLPTGRRCWKVTRGRGNGCRLFGTASLRNRSGCRVGDACSRGLKAMVF